MKRAEILKLVKWFTQDYDRYLVTNAFKDGERTKDGQDMREFMLSCAAMRLKSAADELYETFNV